MRLSFVETLVFTRRIARLGLEDALDGLQRELLREPLAGALDSGTGGCRKIRLADPAHGRGKRGGARVHYLYIPRAAVIYLIFVYGKQEQSTLTPQQKRALKSVVEAIIAEWDDSGSERGGRR